MTLLSETSLTWAKCGPWISYWHSGTEKYSNLTLWAVFEPEISEKVDVPLSLTLGWTNTNQPNTMPIVTHFVVHWFYAFFNRTSVFGLHLHILSLAISSLQFLDLAWLKEIRTTPSWIINQLSEAPSSSFICPPHSFFLKMLYVVRYK